MLNSLRTLSTGGKTKKDALSFFRGTPFANGLDDIQLRELVKLFKTREYKEGEKLFDARGALPTEVVVVRTGQLIEVDDENSQKLNAAFIDMMVAVTASSPRPSPMKRMSISASSRDAANLAMGVGKTKRMSVTSISSNSLINTAPVKEIIDSLEGYHTNYEPNDILNLPGRSKPFAYAIHASKATEVFYLSHERLLKWTQTKGPKNYMQRLQPPREKFIDKVEMFDLDALADDGKYDFLQTFRLEYCNAGQLIYDIGDFASEDEEKMYIVVSGEFKRNIPPPLSTRSSISSSAALQSSPSLSSRGSVDRIAELKENLNLDRSIISEGGYFGSLSLVNRHPRIHCVVCKTAGLILTISKGAFFNFLSNADKKFKAHYVNEAKKTMIQTMKYSNIALFDGLNENQLSNVICNCTWEMHDQESVIFNEGDDGDSFYILLFGDLDVVIGGNLINSISPGNFFGEIALVTDRPRTASIIAREECVLLSMSKVTFEEIFSSNQEFLAQFQLKLAPQNATLKHILYHSVGMECFYQQMSEEYSLENISFWRSCQAYTELKDGSPEQKECANDILNSFVDQGACEMSINLKGTTRKEIVDRMKIDDIDQQIFVKAQQEAFGLMEDSFPRFKGGPHFESFLQRIGNYYSLNATNNKVIFKIED